MTQGDSRSDNFFYSSRDRKGEGEEEGANVDEVFRPSDCFSLPKVEAVDAATEAAQLVVEAARMAREVGNGDSSSDGELGPGRLSDDHG